MRVLIIGSGGREHALCWSLSGSSLVTELFCAPGNGGIADIATCLAVDPMDFPAVLNAVRQHGIEFVVVGPEGPLAKGLVDVLEQAGIPAFGPSQAAAQLESSKSFAKDFCDRFNIPTAAWTSCQTIEQARNAIARFGAPVVVKADGLAAGKGVTIAETEAEAVAAAQALLGGAMGAAGRTVIVEEFLTGEEASFFALCDGSTAIPLAGAQDHKRVGDRDTGPNTGGMGAYSPAPILTPGIQAMAMERIVRPVIAGMAAEGRPFKGILYCGLMLDGEVPRLLEFNVRFGDPEAQVVLARLMSDLMPALIAARDGALRNFDLRWYPETALCVVMAARGYPGPYATGQPIRNLAAVERMDDVLVFHAGTAIAADRQLVSNGGRVLGITALGANIVEAQARAYEAVDRVDWPGGFCRRDIGWRAVQRTKAPRR